MLQDAMRQESEEKGAEGHKVCRSDDCQCVRDGEILILLVPLVYIIVCRQLLQVLGVLGITLRVFRK